MIAQILLLALAAGGAMTDRPLTLRTETKADRIMLQVVGDSAAACEARYQLQVEGSGNRSVQSGTARLEPGKAATLSTVTINRSPAGWQARLIVDPCGGERYELTSSGR